MPPRGWARGTPEIYLVGADGRRREHGTRANASVTNPLYLASLDRIVEALARRYGGDPRVLGWQIDNEPLATPDYSPSSRAAFQAWLAARYGTIDRLNEAWGGAFWSLRYDRFEQVVLPNDTAGNEDKTSPHAVLDFRRYTADATAAFLDRQAAILRRHVRPEQWITTNYTNVSEGADARRTGNSTSRASRSTRWPVQIAWAGRASATGTPREWPKRSTSTGRSPASPA